MTTREHYRKMINTARWRETRATVLSRAGYLCRDCRDSGVVRLATEVHHLEPVEHAHTPERRETLMFDRSNLVALCHECHRARHAGMKGTTRRERRERDEAARAARLFGDPPPGGIFSEGDPR